MNWKQMQETQQGALAPRAPPLSRASAECSFPTQGGGKEIWSSVPSCTGQVLFCLTPQENFETPDSAQGDCNWWQNLRLRTHKRQPPLPKPTLFTPGLFRAL
jgi:hypothetical protein